MNPSGSNQTLIKIYEAALNAIRVKVVDIATSSGTHTRPSINNVSSTILASNANRKYAIVVNNNGFTAYLKFGVAAVVDQGIPLKPGDRFEITRSNLWTGDIRAIKATATAANLDVFEGT